MKDSNY